jgi:hypothetical protein
MMDTDPLPNNGCGLQSLFLATALSVGFTTLAFSRHATLLLLLLLLLIIGPELFLIMLLKFSNLLCMIKFLAFLNIC